LPIKSDFSIEEIEVFEKIIEIFNPALSKNFKSKIKSQLKNISSSDLKIFDEIGFESLPLDVQNYDLVLSNSVLEHVQKLDLFYKRNYTLLKSGGKSVHMIDLSDHLNFFDPNAFLYLTEDEYSKIATENRCRASDH
jgi:hypothetical protein